VFDGFDIKHRFCYKLAPIPTSMFTDSGDMIDKVIKQATQFVAALTVTPKLKSLPPTSEAFIENVQHAIYKLVFGKQPLMKTHQI